MQRLLSIRTRVRSSLRLDTTTPPWWERRGAAATAQQLGFAVSLSLIVIGLPLSWNSAVSSKWASYKILRAERDARDANVIPFETLAREALLAEIIINERRIAKGREPIDWSKQESTTISTSNPTLV
jgi:hypothetical protein